MDNQKLSFRSYSHHVDSEVKTAEHREKPANVPLLLVSPVTALRHHQLVAGAHVSSVSVIGVYVHQW